MKGIVALLSRLGFTPETLRRFLLITLASQLIYSINSIKTVLYGPFQQMLHISNTEIGIAFSGMGLVASLAYIPATWVSDRFSSSKIIAVSLGLVGVSGICLSTGPSWSVVLTILVCWGFLQDGPFWTSILKSVRCVAAENKQGTAFSLLELCRGIIEFLTNGLAIIIYTVLANSMLGITLAMRINAGLMIIVAILCWFKLPDDNYLTNTTAAGRNKEAAQGIKKALFSSECWLTGITACGIYASFVCTLWFFPFLQNVYAIPVTLVAVFQLFNSSLVRMIASPIGGYLADNKFGSSSNFLRLTTCAIALFSAATLFLPKTTSFLYIAMILLILTTISIYMSRSVYYAPIGEMGTAKSYSGAAMAIAAMIGYSPTFWLNPINGYLLDKYPAETAYSIIFGIMVAASFVAFISATFMSRKVKANRLKQANGSNLEEQRDDA